MATDDEAMGEITDEDEGVNMDINEMRDMDEEDIFFGSSSFNTSVRSDEGVSLDADDSFSWGSGPQSTSMFAVNITQSTPSPRAKKSASIPMLEKKKR